MLSMEADLSAAVVFAQVSASPAVQHSPRPLGQNYAFGFAVLYQTGREIHFWNISTQFDFPKRCVGAQ